MKSYRINLLIGGERVDNFVFETSKHLLNSWFGEHYSEKSNSLVFEDIQGDLIFINLSKYDNFYITKE